MTYDVEVLTPDAHWFTDCTGAGRKGLRRCSARYWELERTQIVRVISRAGLVLLGAGHD